MKRMWWYTLGTLVLWVVNPELRRLFEWRFGSPALDVFPLFPFLAVLPHVWSLIYGGGWHRVPRPLVFASWLWLGGFGYALVIAILNNNSLPAFYTFANFVLPMAIGLWVSADRTPFLEAHARLTRLLFILTTVISIYGVVQFVLAPAWDTLWMQRVIAGGALSFGRPAPLQIRVFSVLGSPGPFGSFMALMLLLALPNLSLRRPGTLVQTPFWLIAFGLSEDRSAWLLFALGTLIYLLLTPRRGQLLMTALVSGAIFSGLLAVLPAVTGNDAVFATLGERLETFSDLNRDRSGNERGKLYDSGVSLVADAPFGHGLGVVGTATKLGEASATTDLDSGILARLIEMGLPGAALFAASLAALAIPLVGVLRKARREHAEMLQSLAAMSLAALLSLVGSEISGDVSGLMFLITWLTCGLTMHNRPPLRSTDVLRTTQPLADTRLRAARAF